MAKRCSIVFIGGGAITFSGSTGLPWL
uniref:Uncharacterized protein n=1 Tax=Rhizophora mucronata TaxID=61149 RepID=A0A2P2J8Y2_RHIMU